MRDRWGTFRRMHFVGIGGVGMCALAEILLDDGLVVSGCDAIESERTDLLRGRGVEVAIGHDPAHLEAADAVVVSAAVASANPEMAAARDRGLPVVRRATLLAELGRGGLLAAVAGTHGKTTTTALLAHILDEAGAGATAAVGGLVRGRDAYGWRGASDIVVCEADEFDRSFLELHPLIAVVTNVEPDHLDCYESSEALRSAFATFAARPPFHGRLLVCGDDPVAASLAGAARARTLTYGLGEESELRAVEIRSEGGRSTFQVLLSGHPLGTVDLALPGDHNVRNALAAVGVCLEFGLAFADAAAACATFGGVGRRFETVGERRGVRVLDDYAHHPTEIEAVLRAAHGAFPGRRIVVVFQPHLFSRTRDFADDFGRALATAETAVVVPIYPAREEPIPGVTHHRILDSLAARGGAEAVDGIDLDQAPAILDGILRDGDLLLTLGAGDVDRVGRAWLEAAP